MHNLPPPNFLLLDTVLLMYIFSLFLIIVRWAFILEILLAKKTLSLPALILFVADEGHSTARKFQHFVQLVRHGVFLFRFTA